MSLCVTLKSRSLKTARTSGRFVEPRKKSESKIRRDEGLKLELKPRKRQSALVKTQSYASGFRGSRDMYSRNRFRLSGYLNHLCFGGSILLSRLSGHVRVT